MGAGGRSGGGGSCGGGVAVRWGRGYMETVGGRSTVGVVGAGLWWGRGGHGGGCGRVQCRVRDDIDAPVPA